MIIEDLLAIQIERKHITQGDFSPYLPTLEHLVSDQKITFKFMHQCAVHVHGYDLDPRGLSVIPEVVSYFKELHKRWPYYLFFCAPIQECFAWWMATIYFPVVGREDGNVNYMEVTPKTYAAAMEDFYTHANGLAHKFNFPQKEYMERQSEMTDAINLWCLGRKIR